MSARSWRVGAGLGACAIAALIAGCGTATHASTAPRAVHVNGVQTGDYVRETSATGVNFLVPTDVLAGQGARSFEVAAHPHQWTGPNGLPGQPWPTGWRIGPTASAAFSTSAKVELLVSGSTGQRLDLYWQETCGGVRVGRRGVMGGSGGAGDLKLHSPAVVLVRLPPSAEVSRQLLQNLRAMPHTPMGGVHGENHTCYLAATASTAAANHLHIQIIDY